MEEWLVTDLGIGSGVVGLLGTAVAVIVFVRLRSRRRTWRPPPQDDQWEPVVPRSIQFAGLASSLTRTIAKTEPGQRHGYPWTPVSALEPDSELSSLQSGDLGEDCSSGEFSSVADQSPASLAEGWATPTRRLTVEYSLKYAANMLQIHVSRITSFLVKEKPSPSKLVKVKLTTISSPDEKPLTAKKRFDPETGALLVIALQPEVNLKGCSMRMTVYETRFAKLKEKRLGELVCHLSQLDISPGVTITCIEDLTPCRKKDNDESAKENASHKDHGQLMLTLFYQVDANRMKVLVRKASNLPKRRRTLEKPEYFVILNTICGRQVILSQETKSASGRCPVWNHPLIFDLPAEDLRKYSMQFVVMKRSFNNHKDVVGQVVVGPDVKGTGHAHWIEAIQDRTTESVRWHKVQPF